MPAPGTSLSDTSLPTNHQLDSNAINYFNLAFRSRTPPPFVSVTLPTPKVDTTMKHQPSLPSMPEHVFSNPLSNPIPNPFNSAATTPRPQGRPSVLSGFGVDPPRPPRDGFDKSFWKWRNRSTKSASESDLRDMSFASPLTPLSMPPNFKPFEQQSPRPVSSPFVSESAHVFSLQHPSAARLSDRGPETRPVSPRMGSTASISPMSAPETVIKSSTVSSTPLSSKGLYDKAKKSIEAKLRLRPRKEQCISPPIPGYGSPHSTVDRTGNYHSVHQVTKTGTWFKDEFGKAKLRRKLFGKAPWHRKESGDSFSSVASSMREILKGETPPSTPLSGYLPSSVRVDCVNNQFPGGEAVRVKTPPLTEGTVNGRPRGFFSEMMPPSPEDDPVPFAPGPFSRRNSRQTVRRRSLAAQTKEWWEQVPMNPIHRDPFEQAAAFEFQVPEHLPSSPMCPANKKHTSGGTGLCVYHGRRRGPSGLRDMAAMDGNSDEV
ncbi:hypothetical protein ACJZ2D_006130 [Fusarium nematophilum]